MDHGNSKKTIQSITNYAAWSPSAMELFERLSTTQKWEPIASQIILHDLLDECHGIICETIDVLLKSKPSSMVLTKKRDSIASQIVLHDLLHQCHQLVEGRPAARLLLPARKDEAVEDVRVARVVAPKSLPCHQLRQQHVGVPGGNSM